jgi:DNA-binding NtrC family response regulator
VPPQQQRDDQPSTQLVVDRDELHCRRFGVEVVDGDDRGARVDAGSRTLSIGSEAGNDLVLTDSAVSRHHCELRVTPRGLQVRDLGSTNGTFIDGIRVETAYLPRGKELRVGRTVLGLRLGDDQVREPLRRGDTLGEVFGGSPAMRHIFAVLQRVAPSEATVLFEGETGSGKTLLAETLHQASARADSPFLVVDCGAIPASLIESELFGHTRGAFTGADTERPGAFVSAAGGTLFLDEIGELPAQVQPKLLRALDERRVRPVGSDHEVEVDLRVVAATNRDLRVEVNAGRFRGDLFYRLNTIRVVVPPLRERRDDIPQLVEHFYRQVTGDDTAAPPADLVTRCLNRPWPGNVRELRSFVERAVLLADLEPPPETVPTVAAVAQIPIDTPYRVAKQQCVDQFERQFLTRLIEHFGGNLSAAARAAHTDRNYLRELLRKHGIRYGS